MIKKNLKTMILTSIIILAPIVVGLLLWDQLPEELATHFGKNGEPNGWSSKPAAVFGLPLFLLATHWFCVFFTGMDPKKQNISDKMMLLVMWLCPIVAIFGCGSTYLYALDQSINTTTIGMLLLEHTWANARAVLPAEATTRMRLFSFGSLAHTE